jgi:Flp pilus assembly protein TadD
MKPKVLNEQSSLETSRKAIFLAGGILVLAALVAYYKSFSSPFIFDDLPAITENPTLRDFHSALSPPHNGSGVEGRPLVNLSLAVNYAAGGVEVWGYHAVNLAIHILAGLTLLGIVRRTLLRLGLRRAGPAPNPGASAQRQNFADSSTVLAFAIALIWTVHPLQTESVTCIIQRTESLMGLFYLVTLYCFIRGTENCRSGFTPDTSGKNPDLQSERGSFLNSAFQLFSPSVFWMLASVLACALGMATKEVMVSAPLIVLLYDRTFVAGTFREAWRQRGRWHLGLFGTWLLLGYMVVHMGGSRGDAAGFGLTITPWNYALTQCQAIVLYLGLAVWPYPLVLDYGTGVVQHAAAVAPQALVLVLLVGATIFMLRYRPALGFVGVWFFAILAPSSSVVPLVAQTMAEHRMYLPLAAVVTLVVLGLYILFGQRGVVACIALALGLMALTARRNEDYRSAVAIWSDTVAKCPRNARAHCNLANELLQTGRPEDAMEQAGEALALEPNYPDAYCNLATALFRLGRLPEAAEQYENTLRRDPGNARAQYNLGNVLAQEGKVSEAVGHFEQAVRLKPEDVSAHNNLANALFLTGRVPEAIRRYEETLQLKPDFAEAHNNLGNALRRMGRVAEAIAQFEEVLRLKPGDGQALRMLSQLRGPATEPVPPLK